VRSTARAALDAHARQRAVGVKVEVAADEPHRMAERDEVGRALAAMTGQRATASTSPLPRAPTACSTSAASRAHAHLGRATASRSVSGFAPTSTMRARPRASVVREPGARAAA
jgi:hypothetical protein